MSGPLIVENVDPRINRSGLFVDIWAGILVMLKDIMKVMKSF